MKVLLAGSTGTVGSQVAAELVRSGEVADLDVASRSIEEARRVATRFSGSPVRVQALELDLHDEAEVAEAGGGADVFVSAAGPGYELEAPGARAALAAGVPYVSLCDDHSGTDDALALDDKAGAAGIPIVSGCGLSPGITSFLASHGASELDHVDEIDIALAASSSDTPGYASAQHLVHALAGEAPYLSEGRRALTRAGISPKRVYFPEPVGWVETFTCGHPEISTMARSDASPNALRFRIGLTERAVMDVLRASRAGGLLQTPAARNRWLRLSWPARALLERIPPRGATWTAARVDVHGTRGGTATTISLGVVDHLVNLAAVTLSIAALEIGKGRHRVAGVRGPEEVFEVKTMLERLSARGIRIARLEPQTV